MLNESQLTGSLRATYDAVFQHPIARKLQWQDVRSLLVAMSDVVEEYGEVLHVVRNGRTLVLQRPRRKGMQDVQELMNVRRFLGSFAG